MNLGFYYNLAEAVIIRACLDYTRALKANDADSIAEIEDFFNSDYFQLLTSIESEYLMRKLRELAG